MSAPDTTQSASSNMAVGTCGSEIYDEDFGVGVMDCISQSSAEARRKFFGYENTLWSIQPTSLTIPEHRAGTAQSTR
eukprot:858583-Rhodomonas_salina.2